MSSIDSRSQCKALTSVSQLLHMKEIVSENELIKNKLVGNDEQDDDDNDKKLFQSILMGYDAYKTPRKSVSYNNYIYNNNINNSNDDSKRAISVSYNNSYKTEHGTRRNVVSKNYSTTVNDVKLQKEICKTKFETTPRRWQNTEQPRNSTTTTVKNQGRMSYADPMSSDMMQVSTLGKITKRQTLNSNSVNNKENKKRQETKPEEHHRETCVNSSNSYSMRRKSTNWSNGKYIIPRLTFNRLPLSGLVSNVFNNNNNNIVGNKKTVQSPYKEIAQKVNVNVESAQRSSQSVSKKISFAEELNRKKESSERVTQTPVWVINVEEELMQLMNTKKTKNKRKTLRTLVPIYWNYNSTLHNPTILFTHITEELLVHHNHNHHKTNYSVHKKRKLQHLLKHVVQCVESWWLENGNEICSLQKVKEFNTSCNSFLIDVSATENVQESSRCSTQQVNGVHNTNECLHDTITFSSNNVALDVFHVIGHSGNDEEERDVNNSRCAADKYSHRMMWLYLYWRRMWQAAVCTSDILTISPTQEGNIPVNNKYYYYFDNNNECEEEDKKGNNTNQIIVEEKYKWQEMLKFTWETTVYHTVSTTKSVVTSKLIAIPNEWEYYHVDLANYVRELLISFYELPLSLYKTSSPSSLSYLLSASEMSAMLLPLWYLEEEETLPKSAAATLSREEKWKVKWMEYDVTGSWAQLCKEKYTNKSPSLSEPSHPFTTNSISTESSQDDTTNSSSNVALTKCDKNDTSHIGDRIQTYNESVDYYHNNNSSGNLGLYKNSGGSVSGKRYYHNYSKHSSGNNSSSNRYYNKYYNQVALESNDLSNVDNDKREIGILSESKELKLEIPALCHYVWPFCIKTEEENEKNNTVEVVHYKRCNQHEFDWMSLLDFNEEELNKLSYEQIPEECNNVINSEECDHIDEHDNISNDEIQQNSTLDSNNEWHAHNNVINRVSNENVNKDSVAEIVFTIPTISLLVVEQNS